MRHDTHKQLDRRAALKLGLGSLAAGAALPALSNCSSVPMPTLGPAAPASFSLALAQTALQRRFYGMPLAERMAGRSREAFLRDHETMPGSVFAEGYHPLDFPRIARRELGMDAVGFSSRFLAPKVNDRAFAGKLKSRLDEENVRGLYIVCDTEMPLAQISSPKRTEAIASHYRWIDLAIDTGIPAIVVSTSSPATDANEHGKYLSESLGRLANYAQSGRIDLMIANGLDASASPAWMSDTIRSANSKRVGIFLHLAALEAAAKPNVSSDVVAELAANVPPPLGPDPVMALEQLLPLTKLIYAQCYDFDATGRDTLTDFDALLTSALNQGYVGTVALDYDGNRFSELDGINYTRALMERIRKAWVDAAIARGVGAASAPIDPPGPPR